MISILDGVKVYKTWRRVENSYHKASEEDLKVIKEAEVVCDLYGPRVMLTLVNGYKAFVDLDRECQLAIGDKPNIADLEFAIITNGEKEKKVVL